MESLVPDMATFLALHRKIQPVGRLGVLGLLLVCSLLLHMPRKVLAKCPNWCSQKGICTGPGDDAFCICEMGYQGDDCGTLMCPKGDDPLTTGQVDRAFLLRTTADGGLLSGKLTLSFNGEIVSMDANAHRLGDRECVSALQELPNIDRVSCRRGPVSEIGGAEYTISLLSFPTMPWENNQYAHFGNPALEAFSCNISGGYEEDLHSDVSPSCELVDLVTENVKEYVECSRRGTCTRETGRCDCNFGFKGDACDDISDSDDTQVVLAEGPFFTGSTLKLRANRGLSPDFDFIRALAGKHDVMTLTGTGDLTLHKGSLSVQRHIPGASSRYPIWNAEPTPRALEVLGGSLGVLGGGAEILSTRANAPALAISVREDNVLDTGSGESMDHSSGRDRRAWRKDRDRFSFSGTALSVNVRGTSSSTEELTPERNRFRLLELSVGGKEVGDEDDEKRGGVGQDVEEGRVGRYKKLLMSVRGDGRVFMGGGGGVILGEGDLEVLRGDAKVQGNTTIGGSLSVGTGGVEAANGGGIRVLDGGLHVLSTSPTAMEEEEQRGITGGRSGNGRDGAVGMLSATHPRFSGDVLWIKASGDEAVAAGAGLLRASAGGKDVFEVKATGATSVKSGGLEVEAGGLRVSSGGVIVSSGGLSVDGGLHLRSGTITIDDDGDTSLGSGGQRKANSGGLEVGTAMLASLVIIFNIHQ